MKEASEETVALFRWVHNHPRSTFDDIVAKALPPAMRHAAYQAFTANRGQDGEELPEEWFKIEGNKDLAWRWWVGELVHASVNTKRLSVDAPDGGSARGKRREQLLYSAKTAPMVKTEDGKVVRWSPEFDQAYERAVAAMRVTQRANLAINDLMGDKPTRKQLDGAIQVLKDALEALRVS
jgi:hypothetical protein